MSLLKLLALLCRVRIRLIIESGLFVTMSWLTMQLSAILLLGRDWRDPNSLS